MEQAETSSKTCFAFDSYHTPQSLRDSSSILEEQPDIQLFIFVELTLFVALMTRLGLNF